MQSVAETERFDDGNYLVKAIRPAINYIEEEIELAGGSVGCFAIFQNRMDFGFLY